MTRVTASGVGCVKVWTTLMISIAVGSGQAAAGIVYFENPPPGDEGHFKWHWQGPEEPQTFENWLDITKPSSDQFGLETGNSVAQLFRDEAVNYTFDGADVARSREGFLRTRAFHFDEQIDQNALFGAETWHVFDQGFGKESEFPEGEVRYIGVQTEKGNFGWIAVVRDGFNLSTNGWAYETEPGVPILAGAVPTGATAAPLLMLPFFRRSRRRGADRS